MIILVPLTRYRVSYELGSGRPYSHLERLVLSAVADGAGTITELQKIFHVHQRLLIEVVVTLVNSGWIAVSGTNQRSFMLSPEGQKGIDGQESPSVLRVKPEERVVFVERVCGQIALSNEIKYISNRDLVGDNATVRLTPLVSDQIVSVANVQNILPRHNGEWIRWIGPIEVTSRECHWLPVDVDLQSDSFINLPQTWAALLKDPLYKKAISVDVPNATVPPPKWFRGASKVIAPRRNTRINVSPSDFIYGTNSHEELLINVLGIAKKSVFVASAFISESRIKNIWPHIENALKRGVTIHLLWGYDAEREALQYLSAKQSHIKAQGYGTRFLYNRTQSNSHAKILIWDSHGENSYSCCIGSCNWLSFGLERKGDLSELSFVTNHYDLVANACRCISNLWEATGESLSSVPSYWQRIAADLERIGITASRDEKSNCDVQMIYDQSHEYEMRRWLKEATKRLLVLSHKLGFVADTRLLSAEDRDREVGFEYIAAFSDSDLDESKLKDIELSTQNSKGSLINVKGLHTKAIISDNLLCISSYNFLSADAHLTSENSKEVGIVLTGECVNWVYDKFKKTLE